MVDQGLAQRATSRIVSLLAIENDDDFTHLTQRRKLAHHAPGLAAELTIGARRAAITAVLLVVYRVHTVHRTTGEPGAAASSPALLLCATGWRTLLSAADVRPGALLIRNAILAVMAFAADAARAAVPVLATGDAGVVGRAILPSWAMVVAR